MLELLQHPNQPAVPDPHVSVNYVMKQGKNNTHIVIGSSLAMFGLVGYEKLEQGDVTQGPIPHPKGECFKGVNTDACLTHKPGWRPGEARWNKKLYKKHGQIRVKLHATLNA